MTPRTATTSRSPSFLNNKGVVFLDNERFEEAVDYFKTASSMIRNVITTHRNRIRSTKSSSCGGRTATSASLLPTKKTARAEEDTVRKCVSPLRQEGAPTWCRKKRRRSSYVSARATLHVPETSYCLGRPLWVQHSSQSQEEQTHHAVDLISLSATLLYNLGLCFHMVALRKRSTQAAKLVYERALEFYKMTIDLLMNAGLPRRISNNSRMRASPIIIVSLHNIVQVYNSTQNHKAATRYRNQLSQALRLMVTMGGSNSSGPEAAQHQHNEERDNRQHDTQRYEKFYMGFLSLSKASTMAAAA